MGDLSPVQEPFRVLGCALGPSLKRIPGSGARPNRSPLGKAIGNGYLVRALRHHQVRALFAPPFFGAMHFRAGVRDPFAFGLLCGVVGTMWGTLLAIPDGLGKHPIVRRTWARSGWGSPLWSFCFCASPMSCLLLVVTSLDPARVPPARRRGEERIRGDVQGRGLFPGHPDFLLYPHVGRHCGHRMAPRGTDDRPSGDPRDLLRSNRHGVSDPLFVARLRDRRCGVFLSLAFWH